MARRSGPIRKLAARGGCPPGRPGAGSDESEQHTKGGLPFRCRVAGPGASPSPIPGDGFRDRRGRTKRAGRAKSRLAATAGSPAHLPRDGRGAGVSFIEAVEDGWWYTAPLPEGQRILAFHTDMDLPASAVVRSVDGVLRHAEKAADLRSILAAMSFVPESRSSGRAAGGSVLEPCSGSGWLAAGDAELTFDPLSSQGLLNALFMGLAAAEATHSYLSGNRSAMTEYQSAARGIRAAYRHALSISYAQERRWPAAPFWFRRHRSNSV